MTSSEVNAARATIERELQTLGVALVEPSAGGVPVAVTFSENLGESVWVAEIRHPDRPETTFEVRPKPPVRAAAPPLTIEKTLLLDEDHPILDLAPIARDLLVLASDAVSVYESSAGRWQHKLSVRIPAAHPWPRDLRGRLMVQGDAYQAYLPGLTCQGNASGGLSITCREETLWPVGAGPGMLGFAEFSPARNLFSGRIVTPNGSSRSLPAFFSAAALESRRDGIWAFAGADARIHLYGPATEIAGGWTGWGSDIVAVESECGTRSQMLATAPGDGGTADSISPYEIAGGSPQPAGDAISFSGPVTALWPAAERGVAFAVSIDLSTSRYAAFRLAITCSH